MVWNELKGKKGCNFHLTNSKDKNSYLLRNTGDTPQFQHVAMLQYLCEVSKTDDIKTWHFNILRNVLERTATFHGFSHFSACLLRDKDDLDNMIYHRMISILSHGDYSHFEPREMTQDNKEYFRRILKEFMDYQRFNPDLFSNN